MGLFFGRHESLKAMVHAWPFAHLPLVGLVHVMGLPQEVETAGAGLTEHWSEVENVVRSQCPGVLTNGTSGCSSSSRKQPLAPLEVFIGLRFSHRTRDQCSTHIPVGQAEMDCCTCAPDAEDCCGARRKY